MKPKETQGEQSNKIRHDQPTRREPAPASIAEGRRLYVGNLLYMAKLEDIQNLFPVDEYKVWVLFILLVKYRAFLDSASTLWLLFW